MASFRETGDGPRGLIDAADKLARALRGKAGESLRRVNATPPLFQATTSSFDALRKFSEAVRANTVGDNRAIGLAREAVAIDSTFASAWSLLAATLSNYGGSRSAIDSAVSQAYHFRDRLPQLEREQVFGRYYAMGPGRDRSKAIAAYEGILQRGDTVGSILVNIAEQIRKRREFARAESLNIAAAKLAPNSGTPLGNAVEMQLNEGKLKEAEATIARLKEVAPSYGAGHQAFVSYAEGNDKALRSLSDSLIRLVSPSDRQMQQVGRLIAAGLALRDGKLREHARLRSELGFNRNTRFRDRSHTVSRAADGGPSISLDGDRPRVRRQC
jgi:Flp pilus assembly protein TadD